MFDFSVEQKTFNIGNVKIGGYPGQRPTVLIGSIFYRKHYIMKDERAGEFDRVEAQALIKRQEEFSDKTGNPHMFDVVGATPESMKKFLDFVSANTDAPIVLDGVSTGIRVAGLKYVREVGIKNPIVYDSLVFREVKKEEIETIKDVKPAAAILLAFNMIEFNANGRVKAIKELMDIAESAELQNVLADVVVIDIPSLGQAFRAVYEVKNQFGVPAGCGAHNAVDTWQGLKTKFGKQARDPCTAATITMPIAAGADWVLYGPVDHAQYVFPAVALVDSALAQISIEKGKRPEKTHPLFRIG